MTQGCVCHELRVLTAVLAFLLAVGCGSGTTSMGSEDASSLGSDAFGNDSGVAMTDVSDAVSTADGMLSGGPDVFPDASDVFPDGPGLPVDAGPVVPGPSGCSTASVLPLLATGGVDGFNGHGVESLPACGGHGAGPATVEWFEVLPGPPGTDIQVFATASTPLPGNPVIRIFSDCPPVSCVASSANPFGLATFSVRFTPIAFHPYYVAVGGDPGGLYGYDVTARAVGADTPVNGRCMTALAVRNGTYLHDENTEDAVDPSAACGLGRYPSLFYSAHVGVGQTLHAEATLQNIGPSLSREPGPNLRLAPVCAATTCLASGTAGTPQGQSVLDWSNATGVAADVILGVDDIGLFLFDLSIQIGPPP